MSEDTTSAASTVLAEKRIAAVEKVGKAGESLALVLKRKSERQHIMEMAKFYQSMGDTNKALQMMEKIHEYDRIAEEEDQKAAPVDEEKKQPATMVEGSEKPPSVVEVVDNRKEEEEEEEQDDDEEEDKEEDDNDEAEEEDGDAFPIETQVSTDHTTNMEIEMPSLDIFKA